MSKIAVVLVALFALTAVSPAKTRKRTHSAVSAKRRVVRRAAVVRSRRAVNARRVTQAPPPRSAWQGQPSPERYKDIQQALAGKGYFQGEPNGQWGPDSADALKRFQADQNLASDGKLNSLSLIALGLGPKRTLTAQSATPAPTGAPKQ